MLGFPLTENQETPLLTIESAVSFESSPLILEMNARPGLNIQIANCTGLTNRIARIKEIYNGDVTPEERAAVARREFPATRGHQPAKQTTEIETLSRRLSGLR